jgi:hypothetical protein
LIGFAGAFRRSELVDADSGAGVRRLPATPERAAALLGQPSLY